MVTWFKLANGDSVYGLEPREVVNNVIQRIFLPYFFQFQALNHVYISQFELWSWWL